NVRELENLMRRLAALSREDVISASQVEQQLGRASPGDADGFTGGGLGEAIEHHLALYFASHGDALPPDGLYERILAEIEPPLLRAAMAAARGNQLRAARLLGLNRNTLRKKLSDHDIDPASTRRTGPLPR
ncbi:helix-turn-helix domain-containing protein, partial [uncultured Sphingomonas sp.]|uniref:helix-turn-helix domain-containing protein n=1 Tax=uncultured Sphingomonas sp. TaxID=158754 RepID=UPI00261C38FB